MREIITIQVGGAGIRAGTAMYEQLNAEHGISADGSVEAAPEGTPAYGSFYGQTGDTTFAPRTLLLDLEPDATDDAKTGRLRNMLSNCTLSGKAGGAGNFARGHYTAGKELMEKTKEWIRQVAETCDSLQGFVVHNNMGGGAGSGQAALVLEHIGATYKTPKMTFTSVPSSPSGLQIYNCALASKWLINSADICCIHDNLALGDMCSHLGDKAKPRPEVPGSWRGCNRIAAKMASYLTGSLRFEQGIQDMAELQTNLIAMPRQHFLTQSLGPLCPAAKPVDAESVTQANDAYGLALMAFSNDSMSVRFGGTTSAGSSGWGYAKAEGKFMAMALHYRGNVLARDANDAAQKIRHQKVVSRPSWALTGMKINLLDCSMPCLEGLGDPLAPFENSVGMTGCTTAIGRLFSQRICARFDTAYAARQYVHHLVGEGMEEAELAEAREEARHELRNLVNAFAEIEVDKDEEAAA